MRFRNFVAILAVALLLSGYSSWSLAVRERERAKGVTVLDASMVVLLGSSLGQGPLLSSSVLIPARTRSGQPFVSDTRVADVPLIGRETAAELWRDSSTLFVDVRSPFDYEIGHIAGAVNLPWDPDELARHFSGLKPRLERARVLVVYCKSRDCATSLWASVQLRQQGLTQTVIYPGGWYEWQDGGLPCTTGRGE